MPGRILSGRTLVALVIAATVTGPAVGCATGTHPPEAAAQASAGPTSSPTPGSTRTEPPVAGSRHPRPPAPAATPPSTRPPIGLPKTPSDQIVGDWIVGTVTTEGDGPCHGLVTDDGQTYAMHSTAGITLHRATRIRVRVAPSRLRIDCGPGQQVILQIAEPLVRP